jgi:hypothetical protein
LAQLPTSQSASLDEFLIENQEENWNQTWRTADR